MLYSKLLKYQVEFRRVYAHLVREIRGFPIKNSVFITENILVGGQFRTKKIQYLADWGVTGVVSMRSKYPKKMEEQTLIEFLNLPTKDRTAPSISNLKKGIKFIEKHIQKNGKVYIHCRMGEGRGPTMAASYFISKGMSYEDAIQTIEKTRSFIKINKPQKEVLMRIQNDFKDSE